MSNSIQEKVKILGFAGSLRARSYNKLLLKAAKKLAPDEAEMEIFELDGIPPFNQDFERDPPGPVVEFKRRIKEADAILIATPEYNYSIPGVLKNAIDWASRPHGDNAFEGKPVAIMSASTGMLGGARAQYHLRQVFVFLNMFPINRPEVILARAAEKFSPDGALTDQTAIQLIRELLENLVRWSRLLKTQQQKILAKN
jgi:chromate reductase